MNGFHYLRQSWRVPRATRGLYPLLSDYDVPAEHQANLPRLLILEQVVQDLSQGETEEQPGAVVAGEDQ